MNYRNSYNKLAYTHVFIISNNNLTTEWMQIQIVYSFHLCNGCKYEFVMWVEGHTGVLW